MRKLETLVFDTLKIENCSNNTQSLSLAGSETITSFNFVIIEFTKRMAYCLNTLIALNFNKKKIQKKNQKKER